MKSISKCPGETILKAVVLGEINEPLLDYYLGHIDDCERCTEIIDKSSWHQFEFQKLITRSQVDLKQLKPDRESLDLDWLESVKKNYPSKDFIPANNPDNALGLPEVVGNYRLGNLLGSGATSMVYQAMDMNLLREVALKILHPEFNDVPNIQESIMSEARAIASLSHENILPIFHVEKLETNPVLVFPLLPGCTLQKALEERKFNLRETLKIICDLCGALDFIHSRGIIHRDIKPSNIWLENRADGSQKPLLFDFGFAGMKQNRSGTSGYMAPEQILHQKNSPATDMFALGSLLFLMADQDEAPEMIKNIIHQLLMENPADRPTAAQLSKSLDEWLNPKQQAPALAGLGDSVDHIEKYLPLFAKPSHKGDLGSFGKFRIIAEIGHGSMGVFFDAYDTLENRRVTLKTIKPDLLRNQTLCELFLDEARNAAKLVHPNIVMLLDVDAIQGVPYITMPLLKGESLQEFLNTNPHGVGKSLFLPIARQLISAIEHLHSKGVFHRDIRPSDIFLETGLDGKIHVILLIVGLARLVEVAGYASLGLRTPEFAAPEQIQGAKIDARADIFSLGKVLEKMLYGLDYQTSTQPVKKFIWNFNSDPLADLIRKMTDPLPSNRPASVIDVIKSLDYKPRLKPLRVGVLILPFVLIAMALIYFSFNHPEPSLDNSLNTNPVTIEPIATVATVLDLFPNHIFRSVNSIVYSISGNGGIFAYISYQNNLALNYASDPEKKANLALPYVPNSVVLNQEGNLLAISSIGGDLSIVKIPTGLVLFTMQDKEKIQFENLQWGGKNSDVLLFSQNKKLFQLKSESQDQYPNMASEIQDSKVLKNVVNWENIVPLPGSDFFLANIGMNNGLKRLFIIYNIYENKIVKVTSPAPNLDINNKSIKSIGWISNELFFATQNRNLFEYGWIPNNDSQNLNMFLVKASEIPHAPDDLIWLDNNHFVALADIGGNTPFLHLYNRENLASYKKIETNGEWVKQLKKLDGNSFAAFCKSGKILTYTLSDSLAN